MPTGTRVTPVYVCRNLRHTRSVRGAATKQAVCVDRGASAVRHQGGVGGVQRTLRLGCLVGVQLHAWRVFTAAVQGGWMDALHCRAPSVAWVPMWYDGTSDTPYVTEVSLLATRPR